MKAIWRLVTLGLGLLLLAVALPAMGGNDAIIQDFAPRQGVLIGMAGEEFLLDLGRDSDIIPGDLVEVIRQGEAIIHPVTNEALGFQSEVVGSLQITRVEERFSYARAEKTMALEPGTLVRLYDGAKALWCDKEQGDEVDFAELRRKLPALRWDMGCADEGLSFRAVNGRLEARSGATLLRSYPLSRKMAASAEGEVTKTAAGVVSGEPWYGPVRKEAIRGIAVADLDADGEFEGVTLYAHRLVVARLKNGSLTQIAESDLGAALDALAIDAIDLDQDGKAELYITAAYPDNLSSRVYTLENGALKLREKGIPAYFKSMGIPDKGQQLLAQRIGGEGVDYLGGWHPVVLKEGEVVLDEPIVTATDGLPLRGATLGKEGEIYRLSHLDHLEIIDAKGERLWLDEEQLGGSEVYFERNDPTQPLQSPDHTRYVYMPSRVERLDDGTIVTVANSGDRQLRRARNMTSGLLRAFRWDGVVLRPVWSTPEEDGPISDFTLADIDNDGADELVLAVQIKGGGFFGGSKGRLVVRELIQP